MMEFTHDAGRQDIEDIVERLDDEDLLDLIARAQGCLLDRPIRPGATPALRVEIVARDEEYMLACYRALSPTAREGVRRQLTNLAHETAHTVNLTGAMGRGV